MEMFESRFNLFLWPEAGIQELRVFMLNCVGQTVMEASNLKADDLWDRGRFVSRRARSSSSPPYLFHEVPPFYGRDTRLTVASNC